MATAGTCRFYWARTGKKTPVLLLGARAYLKPLPKDIWTFIAITWSGEEPRLYINAEEKSRLRAKKMDLKRLRNNLCFLMPGNSESGAGFGPKTHIDGVVDRFCVLRRELSAEEISALMQRKEPLVRFEGVHPRLDTPCRVFSRDLRRVPVRSSLVNFREKRERVRARFRVESVGCEKELELTLRPKEVRQIVYELPVEKLSVGDYRLLVTLEGKGSAWYRFSAAPHRNPERLLVLAWGGTGKKPRGGRDFCQSGRDSGGNGSDSRAVRLGF